MALPLISVIICTYNRGKFLIKALESLASQEFNPGKFEIIIVNNNSTDSTHEIIGEFIKTHPDLSISYCIEKQQGLSFSRNRGIQESKGEILAFLDDDAYAVKNYLSSIDSFFSENSEILAAGGKILPDYEKAEPGWMNPFLESLVSIQDMGGKIRLFKTARYPIGANMIIKKSAFNTYGLFNTNLGRKGNVLSGGEEKDFFYRLTKDRNEIYYIPDAIVSHFIPESRLHLSFIKKLGEGIGASEIMRLKNSGFLTIVLGIIKEIIKWGVSFILMIYYFLILKPGKGVMIMKFRSYVTCGMSSQLRK